MRWVFKTDSPIISKRNSGIKGSPIINDLKITALKVKFCICSTPTPFLPDPQILKQFYMGSLKKIIS